MSDEAHAKLARVEISLGKGAISWEDYKSQKWEILSDLHQQMQTAKPIFRDQRPRRIEDPRGVAFNYIPPSPFIFGKDAEYAELKAGIYMATYPVTVRDFQIFLEESGWDYSEADLEKLSAICPASDCPVSHISWIDAKEYCRWLRRVTKEYYSLPNEYEWEIAARGIDGRLYPWGYEEPDADYGCFQGERHYTSTVPVGTFPSNQSPYGCVDMVGNVWEWCLDSVDDPRDPHILRGGSWRNGVEFATCISQTYSYPPDKRVDSSGFRIIYLPGDMLQDYQNQQNSVMEAPQRRLAIVGRSGGDLPQLDAAEDLVSQTMTAADEVEGPITQQNNFSERSAPVDGLPAETDDDLVLEQQQNQGVPDKTLEKLSYAPLPESSNERQNKLSSLDSPKRSADVSPRRDHKRIASPDSSPSVGSAEIKVPKADYDSLEIITDVSRSGAKPLPKTSPKRRESRKETSAKSKPKASKSENQAAVDDILAPEKVDTTTRTGKTNKIAVYLAYGVWSILLICVITLFIMRVLSLS